MFLKMLIIYLENVKHVYKKFPNANKNIQRKNERIAKNQIKKTKKSRKMKKE